ncbi:MAG: Gfo/Idh/MocA family oxidoreductase [Verrucomicrobiota bacterium]|jgi:predicted dehydrogenase
MNNNEAPDELNRRDFLINTSLASLLAMTGCVELRAADSPKPAGASNDLTPIPVGPPVSFGVIGAGVWGREILTTLAQLPNAPVVAVCEHYPAWLNRAGELAPKAGRFDDYQKLLAKKEVQAVVVATPTHQHRDIVLAALAAGKHVYCEAPLANSIEDAKAIARAAQSAFKLVFQAGLQERAHPQRHFLWPFIRSGALGRNALARAQWHKKGSWARTASTPEREKELNWRLRRDTSTGLMGECCLHLLDAVTWFLGARPAAVTGFSSLILWNDGRDVPDTALGVFEFADGAHFLCDATLCNSFDSQYEMYYGTDSAILVRESKAWMFREADAPAPGWEVYARKENFGSELGVSLIANASKQAAQGKNAVEAAPYPYSPLYYALQAFTDNVATIHGGVDDFVASYGEDDPQALREHLATLKKQPAAGWKEGLEATVLAIKANEAALARQRIELKKEFFEL